MSESLAAGSEHAYDALTGQLAYRRERRHTIFAWCSSIFVAAIGGLAAFAKTPQDLTLTRQYIITATIGILALFTVYWMYHHWKIETKLQMQIDAMNGILRIDTSDPKKHFVDWAQTLAVLGLGVTALAATWSIQSP